MHLKSCILRHLDDTGIIFKDRKYLEKLSKCWTHDLVQLMELAGLAGEFSVECSSNPALDANWGAAKDWTEVSRYEQKTSHKAHRAFQSHNGRARRSPTVDTATLVEKRKEDGRRLIGLLDQRNIDVTVAAWVKTSEEGSWFLYIATEEVDNKGLVNAYREVYGLLRSIEGTCISTSDIKLVGKKNAITTDLMAVRNRVAHGSGALHSLSIGSISAEEVYAYPIYEPLRQVLHGVLCSAGRNESLAGAHDAQRTTPERDSQGHIAYSTAQYAGEAREDETR